MKPSDLGESRKRDVLGHMLVEMGADPAVLGAACCVYLTSSAAKLRGRFGHVATSLEFASPPLDAGEDATLSGLIESLRSGFTATSVPIPATCRCCSTLW